MLAQPYLQLEGKCEEAFSFYRDVLGGEIESLMRWRDMPGGCEANGLPAELGDKVMHAALKVGSTLIMGSDGYAKGPPEFKGFAIALTLPTDDETERAFASLAEGGSVQMPPGRTFFTSRFGQCTDRYGVQWMILTEMAPAHA